MAEIDVEHPQLSRWQGPDGFPSDDYFAAVEIAVADLGLPVEYAGREDYFEFNLQLFRGGFQEGPLSWATELWISWRCDELDEPAHADDFTGLGWYWVPYSKPGAGGDFAKEFVQLPYLADPDEVAAAINQLVSRAG